MLHFAPHSKKKYKKEMNITVGNTVVKPQQSARYLSVIFDRKLQWQAHVEETVRYRITLIRFLARATGEALNTQITLNLFKTLIRTVITYGSSAIPTADDKTWQRLQIVQNKGIRAALGVPIYTSVEYVHRVSKIQKIKPYSIELTRRSLDRALYYEDMITQENINDIIANF
ncbi:unnamed protein product [Didymodactylos carnosus]|uniref:Uncharacterized protein n=1 Tax=Didymodactylos carnosus TaxID=1234261 RepID=A0A813U1C6_9BILA|nr:unnamed protein product [Didymodactylos carnosus]CAF1500544.1 unnamed protein product [Didymodactylos carnosus]CAF3605708.1 unnamed protein product [Didymodactylos carnosus]CAF4289081.1 unnamed protein product [Didymodactylos carnosus]